MRNLLEELEILKQEMVMLKEIVASMSNKVLPEKKDINDTTVSQLLMEVGIPVSLQGYGLIKEAVIGLCSKDCITKINWSEFYAELAARNASTAVRVERSMRYAIETAWRNAKEHEFYKGLKKEKPNNKEFIMKAIETIKISR